MTAAIPGLAPADDDQLIVAMHQRIRKLENAKTVRVGPWVLSNDPETNNLRATRPGQSALINDDGEIEELSGAELSRAMDIDLTGYVTSADLNKALDELPDIPTLPDIPAMIGGAISSAFTGLYQLLTGVMNPVNAIGALANFFRVELGGLISSARLPLIPLSHIRDVNPNLLTDGSFDDEESLAGFPDWDYDEADGKSRTGAAYTIADGNTHILHSNPIEVNQGDKLAIEVFTRWLSLTSTTGSIQVAMSSYTADNVLIGGAPTIIAQTQGSGTIANWNTRLASASGGWEPPSTADYVVMELIVTGNATAGVVKFDDASVRKIGAFPQSFVQGLVGALQEAATNLGNMINTVWTGVTRAVLDAPKTLADMFDALQQINPLNVLGLGGFPNIFQTIGETWNALWGGFARQIGIGGKSIADAANAAADVSKVADEAAQVGEWNNAILGIRDANGYDSGMDPTAVSMYQVPFAAASGGDPPLVSLTAPNVALAFWKSEDDATRGSLSFYARSVGTLTAFYVDVYTVNKTTNQLVLHHTSFDLLPQLSSSWKSLRYNMITANRLPVVHGDDLAFGFRPQGSGSLEVAGHWAGWLPADTAAVPQRPSARRTGGASTVALSALTWTGDIPWIGVGIVEGDITPPFYTPRTTELSTPGTVTYQIPTWAMYVDVIALGAGGGGAGGTGGTGIAGRGGAPGLWMTETLVRGVDFPVGATSLSFTIGAKGSAGGVQSNGGDGGFTRRNAISSGKAAMTATGGQGGQGQGGGSNGGQAPGNMTYRGVTYQGGAGAPGPSAGNAGGFPGGDPGSGGGGGAGGFYGFGNPGGSGGRGGAWVVARQNNN